jgi:hypothetical protein
VCDEKNREVGLMLKEYSDVVQCEEKWEKQSQLGFNFALVWQSLTLCYFEYI